jgi:hypothetical protein
MADWQAAQYWIRMSGVATALQTMQLLGMIAMFEWSGVRVVDVDADRSRLPQSEAFGKFAEHNRMRLKETVP